MWCLMYVSKCFLEMFPVSGSVIRDGVGRNRDGVGGYFKDEGNVV